MQQHLHCRLLLFAGKLLLNDLDARVAILVHLALKRLLVALLRSFAKRRARWGCVTCVAFVAL
jgi:hypothetical protein